MLLAQWDSCEPRSEPVAISRPAAPPRSGSATRSYWYPESGEREPFPAFLYVYVADADEAYRRALAADAESLEAPRDTLYGDRRAMVRDPYGNVFQIAHRRENGPRQS